MKKILYVTIIIIAMLMLISCTTSQTKSDETNPENTDVHAKSNENSDAVPDNLSKIENIKTIYLAGGCFWGVEAYFSRLNGVINAESGYANGNTETTDYQKIHDTMHAETVKIDYDANQLSLEEILLHYFNIIDPKSLNKQGNDIGTQYRTAVYYTDNEDKKVIEKVFHYIEEEQGEIVVENEELKNFIKAEDYHQDYLDKNPNGYCHIDLNGAKKNLFNEKYKNPNDDAIKKSLDDLSYSVLRENNTEPAGTSELDQENRKGIYVDKITGEPLFSSSDKFDSGCGWPSFSKPITSKKINYKSDATHGLNRIEVRSSGGDNHLGHVFDDGPQDKGGLRYCINGASLRFIPYEEMEKEGYQQYKIFVK